MPPLPPEPNLYFEIDRETKLIASEIAVEIYNKYYMAPGITLPIVEEIVKNKLEKFVDISFARQEYFKNLQCAIQYRVRQNTNSDFSTWETLAAFESLRSAVEFNIRFTNNQFFETRIEKIKKIEEEEEEND